MIQQRGFAHAFLIIGLVVALIGALGFVFWQNFIYKEPVAKQETIVVTEKEKTETKQVEKTFTIADYGVKFTVPTELSDATIKYESRQIGESAFLAFTTQRTVELGGDCAKGYPFGDLVTLSRDAQPKSNEYQVYTSEKINNYYYHVGTVESSGLEPKSTCPDNRQAKSDENSLVEALKNLASQS